MLYYLFFSVFCFANLFIRSTYSAKHVSVLTFAYSNSAALLCFAYLLFYSFYLSLLCLFSYCFLLC
uniref:ORF65a n=1 Tax=Saccharolobus islandicus TaxID=43080 RepID=Q9C4Y1_SACIS|nr:ORF65a [Sulfolobus islandicus]